MNRKLTAGPACRAVGGSLGPAHGVAAAHRSLLADIMLQFLVSGAVEKRAGGLAQGLGAPDFAVPAWARGPRRESRRPLSPRARSSPVRVDCGVLFLLCPNLFAGIFSAAIQVSKTFEVSEHAFSKPLLVWSSC